jgi:hypothetical protein
MKTITEKEYLAALGIVRTYLAQIKTETNSNILDRDLSDCKLHVRTLTPLIEILNLKTVRDLVNMSPRELKNTRTLGKCTFTRIENFLEENKLFFGMPK